MFDIGQKMETNFAVDSTYPELFMITVVVRLDAANDSTGMANPA